MTYIATNNNDFPALSRVVQKRNIPLFISASRKQTTEVPDTCFALPSPSNGLQINHLKFNPVVIKNGVMNDMNSGINHQLPIPKPKVEPISAQGDDGFCMVKRGPSGKLSGTPEKSINNANIMQLPFDKGNTCNGYHTKYTVKPQTSKSMKKNKKRITQKASA
jgi:hypothetical protein